MSHETRVEAGFKAALKNPNVGDAAKDHARAELESRGVHVEGGHERTETGDTDSTTESVHHTPHENKVIQGLQSSLKNKNTTEEGKERVKEKLEALGVDTECVPAHSGSDARSA